MRGNMDRSELIQNYLAGEFYQPFEVGADFRKDKILGAVDTFLREYLPEKVLRLSFVKNFTPEYLKLRKHYVLENYFENIKLFLSNQGSENIFAVNGSYSLMPLDYEKFDMVICSDILDMFDSINILEESKRVLNPEGYFLFTGVVLPDSDIDGVYDELIKCINPVHSDYYLETDLKTFADLKGFDFIKSEKFVFRRNLKEMVSHYSKFYFGKDVMRGDHLAFLSENEALLAELYCFDGEEIDENYEVVLFRKKKL